MPTVTFAPYLAELFLITESGGVAAGGGGGGAGDKEEGGEEAYDWDLHFEVLGMRNIAIDVPANEIHQACFPRWQMVEGLENHGSGPCSNRTHRAFLYTRGYGIGRERFQREM